MTVKDLIAALSQFPPEAEVVAPDSEEGINSIMTARVTEYYNHGDGHYASYSSAHRTLPRDTVVILG